MERKRAAPRRRTPPAAPELPPDVLHAILLPLAGDIATLCAAACVSRAWRDTALHPRLWAKLELHAQLQPDRVVAGRVVMWRHGRLGVVTNARLAELVRRACCVDSDGFTHKLLSLRATRSQKVTLRGVLAALRGPRDDAGKPLLRGALRTLHVSGVKHNFTRGDAKLVDQLAAFVRPPSARREVPNLDIAGGITACTRVRCGVDGVHRACDRVASTVEHACEECGVALCAQCCRSGDDECEHMCFTCGRVCDDDDLHMCMSCDSKGHPYSFCDRCMWHCAGDCGASDFCLDCGGCVDEFFWCTGCGASYCGQCAFGDGRGELGHMLMCSLGGCANCYCPDCAERHLIFTGEDEEADDEESWMVCTKCLCTDKTAAELRRALRPWYGYTRCSSDEDEDDDDGYDE